MLIRKTLRIRKSGPTIAHHELRRVREPRLRMHVPRMHVLVSRPVPGAQGRVGGGKYPRDATQSLLLIEKTWEDVKDILLAHGEDARVVVDIQQKISPDCCKHDRCAEEAATMAAALKEGGEGQKAEKKDVEEEVHKEVDALKAD